MGPAAALAISVVPIDRMLASCCSPPAMMQDMMQPTACRLGESECISQGTRLSTPYCPAWRQPWAEQADKRNAHQTNLWRELSCPRRCLPHLKTTMRGAGWEENHWLQMFQLIGLKTTGSMAVSKETVTLAHFLDVADAVVRAADQIKALDAQAQVNHCHVISFLTCCATQCMPLSQRSGFTLFCKSTTGTAHLSCVHPWNSNFIS